MNDTMYVVTPYPNILYALDLTQPGAPLSAYCAKASSVSKMYRACFSGPTLHVELALPLIAPTHLR